MGFVEMSMETECSTGWKCCLFQQDYFFPGPQYLFALIILKMGASKALDITSNGTISNASLHKFPSTREGSNSIQ